MNKGEPSGGQDVTVENTTSDKEISIEASNVSTPQDENFQMCTHSENSLQVMTEYLHKQQLTDITLIAGVNLM